MGGDNLADLVPSPAEPDAVFAAFVAWTDEQVGLTLYPAQTEALLEIATGSHVILSTLTGSAKSLVAAGAQIATLAVGRRSFDTAPIKALVGEKFFALCAAFGAHNVGMMTGDATVSGGGPIICCTAEIQATWRCARRGRRCRPWS